MKKQKYQDGGAVKRGNDMAEMRERERRMDMKAGSMAPTKSLRPKMRPDVVDVSPSAEAKDQEHIRKFKKGGTVEAPGMKSCQMSGRGGGKIF